MRLPKLGMRPMTLGTFGAEEEPPAKQPAKAPALLRAHRPAGSAQAGALSPAVLGVLAGLGPAVLAAAPAVNHDVTTEAPIDAAGQAAQEALVREILFHNPSPETPQFLWTTLDSQAEGLAKSPTIPPGASALFQAILRDTIPFLDEGTVPAELFITTNNLAAETVLIDPAQIFLKMGELIEHAQHDVAFQTFAWDSSSQPVQTIFRSLEKLQSRLKSEHREGNPVTVRFLIDAMDIGANGNLPTVRLMSDIEREAKRHGLDSDLIRIEVAANRHNDLASLHAKTLVVDGLFAVVTGANANHNDDFETGEHDSGFLFMGEVARALLADFDDGWLNGEVWRCGTDRPSVADPRNIARPSTGWGVCLAQPEKISHWVRPLPELPAGMGVPMAVLGKHPVGSFFEGGRVDNPLAQALLAAFKHAKELIRIQTPNLNDEDALAALKAALQSEKRVELILSKGYEDFSESVPGQGGTNEQVVKKLYAWIHEQGLDAAKERLEIRWYSDDGVAPVVGNTVRASHVKVIYIDDQVTIVMSKNMDTQSWNHSREVGVMVDSRHLTRAWVKALFQRDASRSFRVDPLTYAPGRASH